MAVKVEVTSLFRPWAASDQDSTVSTTTLLTSSDERVQLVRDSHVIPPGCTKQPKGHSKSDQRLRKSVKTTQDGSLIKQTSSEEVQKRNSVSLASPSVPSNSFPPVIPGSSSAFAVHDPTSACSLVDKEMMRTFLPSGMHLNSDMSATSVVADVWSEAFCCPDVLLLGHGFLQTPAAVEHYATFLQHQQAKQARKQRPKKYSCPHCRVAFSNNGQLKGHIRIHTGERPFKCDVVSCGKTFTRNEELTRHKRIHSGLRPFACSTCGKRFGRKDHLKKHSRTHTAHARLSVPLPLSALCYNPYLYGY